MKVFVALLFIAGAVALSSAKSCKDSDECEDDQCCAGFTPFRGTCKSPTKKNQKCLVDEGIFPFNEIYIVSCPCAEGLECQAKEGSKNKNDGVCGEPQTTTEEATTEAKVQTTDEPEQPTTADSGENTGDSGEHTEDPNSKENSSEEPQE